MRKTLRAGERERKGGGPRGQRKGNLMKYRGPSGAPPADDAESRINLRAIVMSAGEKIIRTSPIVCRTHYMYVYIIYIYI